MISVPSRLFRSVFPNTAPWAFMQPQWCTASARFTAAANRNLQLGLLGRKGCWKAVEASLFPSVFQGGVAAPLKPIPRSILSGADGVVSKRSRSHLICSPEGRSLFCLNLLTTPSAPLRNGIILLMAQPPLLENGGE